MHAVDPPPISFENNTLLRMGLSNQRGVDLHANQRGVGLQITLPLKLIAAVASTETPVDCCLPLWLLVL